MAEYRKRLSTLCDFRVIELPEQPLREDSPALVQRALEKEAQAILASVRKGAAIVALCVEGKTLSSEELAAWLDDLGGKRRGDVAFVIGSSHGLAPAVKQARGAAPVNTRSSVPSAGPPGAYRADLPGLLHQPEHQVP